MLTPSMLVLMSGRAHPAGSESRRPAHPGRAQAVGLALRRSHPHRRTPICRRSSPDAVRGSCGGSLKQYSGPQSTMSTKMVVFTHGVIRPAKPSVIMHASSLPTGNRA
jgi:hypothetical protein